MNFALGPKLAINEHFGVLPSGVTNSGVTLWCYTLMLPSDTSYVKNFVLKRVTVTGVTQEHRAAMSIHLDS